MTREPLPAIHKRLDAIVSQIVRVRDRYCVTCHQPVLFNGDGLPITLTCSHFVRRGHQAVRWHLSNCNCQCSGCNQYHDGNEKPYRLYMVGQYGKHVVSELEGASFRTKAFTRPDLLDLEAELKAELEDLLAKNEFKETT
jgi:hypothetical protein